MRSATGIPGLDGLIEGGLEEGTVTLVSGRTGTCKSIFCGQFLYNGVMQKKETGIYITTEDSAVGIKRQLSRFGWDFDALEKKGWIKIIEFLPTDVTVLTTKVVTAVEKLNAKRIVIDSVSILELFINDVYEIRKGLLRVIQKIRELGKVGLLTAEVQEDSQNLSRFGVMEFMVDAVIVLQYMGIAKYKRSLMVRKMRITNHNSNIHPFEVGKKGITVKPISR
jgi:circadian clock protein KaiC